MFRQIGILGDRVLVCASATSPSFEWPFSEIRHLFHSIVFVAFHSFVADSLCRSMSYEVVCLTIKFFVDPIIRKIMKRRVENQLLEWRNQDRREVLLVRGARQVGKTDLPESISLHSMLFCPDSEPVKDFKHGTTQIRNFILNSDRAVAEDGSG